MFHFFSNSISVTNNGMSVIPALSLGKPAAIFDIAVGKKRISFEPQLRFALDGKPWSFLFWGRYKLLQAPKLSTNLGAHYGFSFKTQNLITNQVEKEFTTVNRYVAGDLTSSYLISKNSRLGLYYLYSRGVNAEAIRNTHFLMVSNTFSNIPLLPQFFMRIIPQVYYLKMNNSDGFYCSAVVSVAKTNFPISLSFLGNKIISTKIAGDNFAWNLTLTYSFSKRYAQL